MVELIKVTSKGQITLPIEIRKLFGIRDDSYLMVEKVGDFILLKKAEVRMKEIQKIFSAEAKRKKITRKMLLKELNKTRTRMWT